MNATHKLSRKTGVQPACHALGVNRASFYRAQVPRHNGIQPERPRPPLALSVEEEQRVLDTLHSERFMDCSPYQIYAALLDEAQYLCSIRTFYRILERHHEVRERRNQRCHPNYTNRSCLPPRRIRCGRGTSPSSKAPLNGPIFTSTSSSISLAVVSLGGWWLTVSRPNWPGG